MTYVGIDVSKTTFIVAYSSAKGGKTKSFKNTVNGIHEFIQTISAVEHHCVLEATGNYSAQKLDIDISELFDFSEHAPKDKVIRKKVEEITRKLLPQDKEFLDLVSSNIDILIKIRELN